jgi:uncharacterized protein (DUF2252 family)
MYTTLKFLALQGAPYLYDISRLRVNVTQQGRRGKLPDDDVHTSKLVEAAKCVNKLSE